MSKKESMFFLFILFIFVLLIIVISYVKFHENAHLEINNMFGCTGSYIEYNYLLLSGTTNDGICNISKEENLKRLELHAKNEIFGYHLLFVIISILFSGFFISFAIINNKQS